MTVNPPLTGTGPLSGTLNGSTIKFSVGDGTYTGTVNASTLDISGMYTYPGQNGVWKATPTSQCTKDYSQPSNWDTAKVKSTTPGIADYTEPLNVIISACSTVSLGDIQAAPGDWVTVYPSAEVTLDHAHIKCISPEEANVAGHGYATEQQAWRYKDCLEGNILSVAGLENHVRIWNQPVPGSKYGA
jgi:hypothetical protein